MTVLVATHMSQAVAVRTLVLVLGQKIVVETARGLQCNAVFCPACFLRLMCIRFEHDWGCFFEQRAMATSFFLYSV